MITNIDEAINSEVANVDMNSDKLAELEKALNFQLGIIKGIVVVRKGQIAFEKYFKGCGSKDPHHITSVTQSILSALIGIAIDKGQIESVDLRVLDFFPELASKVAEPLKSTLTIKHLLTMEAPYAWKGSEPLDRLRRKKDWVAFILETLKPKGKLGEFQFNLSSAHLLSAILTKSTGVSACEYANEHLFSHLGIKEIADQKMKSFSKEDVYGDSVRGWIKDPQEFSTGGWGLALTTRDMARVGSLYLNNGKWGDKQIISESWVKESLARHSEEMGYSWWLREDNGIETFMAAGISGTYIYCIPEKEIVVAISSQVDKMIIDRWDIIADYIIPAAE